MASDNDRAEQVAAYVASLLPVQQQAIATAQLAGCLFERREVVRDLGWTRSRGLRPRDNNERWANTTVYDAWLPDGTPAGMFEDIYEGALVCLSIMNTPTTIASTDALFQLRDDNEAT